MQTRCAVVLLLFVAVPAFTGLCATRVWDGETDTLYTNGVNWVGDTVPVNSDYTDNILFMENAPGNKEPYLSANRSVNTVTFSNSVGWVFSGAQLTARQFNSSGTGTNTFNAPLKNAYAYGFNVASNNVLYIAGGFYLDGTTILKLEGGGTLRMGSAIGGWSSARRLRIFNGTLLVEANAPFASNGAAIIASRDARVRLKTDVATASSRIGTFVLDETGIGLRAIDLGGGYAQIEVIPPPKGTLVSLQ